MKWLMMAAVCFGSLLMNTVYGATAAPKVHETDSSTGVLQISIHFIDEGENKYSCSDVEWAQQCLDKASKGNVESLYQLGLCLFYGTGVRQDKGLGFLLIRRAAISGEPSAMFDVYLCYHNGWGVARDVKKAYQWFCHYKAAVRNERKDVDLLPQSSDWL